MSRKEKLQQGGDSPLLTMPPVEYAEYIIPLWHEAGTVGTSAGGITPLTWDEINNYVNTLSLDLSNWELLAIKRLSQEYCGEYHQASDKDRPAPYVVAEEEIDRVALGNKFKNILRSFKRKSDDGPKYEVE